MEGWVSWCEVTECWASRREVTKGWVSWCEVAEGWASLREVTECWVSQDEVCDCKGKPCAVKRKWIPSLGYSVALWGDSDRRRIMQTHKSLNEVGTFLCKDWKLTLQFPLLRRTANFISQWGFKRVRRKQREQHRSWLYSYCREQ